MARRPDRVVSHWYHYVEGFSTSALAFYMAVEEAVQRRDIPDVALSRVTFKEGGIASADREYLRIGRRRTVFDLCAAPFGRDGYFFSWWLVELPGNPWLWLGLTAAAGLAFVLLLGLLFLIFGRSCAGAVAAAITAFAAIPTGLFLLGWGVKEGAIGYEEDVLAIPVVGWLYERLFQPATYYRMDTALMFQEAVRASVNEVLAGILGDQGVRVPSQEEWAPRHQVLR